MVREGVSPSRSLPREDSPIFGLYDRDEHLSQKTGGGCPRGGGGEPPESVPVTVPEMTGTVPKFTRKVKRDTQPRPPPRQRESMLTRSKSWVAFRISVTPKAVWTEVISSSTAAEQT